MHVAKITVGRSGLVNDVMLSNGEPLEGIINAGLHMVPGQPIQLVLFVDMDEDTFQVATDLSIPIEEPVTVSDEVATLELL